MFVDLNLYATLMMYSTQSLMKLSTCTMEMNTWKMLVYFYAFFAKQFLLSLQIFWSTKTFLYDIWEPRYKQIKMGYQMSKCLNIGQSQCLEICCPILFYFNFGSVMFHRNGFELSVCFIRMSSLKWDMSEPSKMFLVRETMH